MCRCKDGNQHVNIPYVKMQVNVTNPEYENVDVNETKHTFTHHR